jgi:hypothetical protein
MHDWCQNRRCCSVSGPPACTMAESARNSRFSDGLTGHAIARPKPIVTDATGELPWAPRQSHSLYRCTLDFVEKICVGIRDFNPHDMIDRQSFLWSRGRKNIETSMIRSHSVLIRLVFCILVRTKTLKTKCIAVALSALLHRKNALENS